jgi:hypothetical protein
MADYRVKQLSVFIENKPGRLTDITNALGDAEINIRGFSIADMADYGIFRVIADDAAKAKSVLDALDFTVKESDVICVSVEDKPGQLARALNSFSKRGISVEYMYIIADTRIAFSVEDIDAAVKALTDEGISLLTQTQVAGR